MTGSVSTPNFVSIMANLSLAAEIPARVNADSTLRIHVSILALSREGKSTFLGTSLKSEGCTDGWGGAVDAVDADERRTASNAAATDVSVAALTVASTNALMEAGSMAEDADVVVDSKKGPPGAVGDGDGVLVALFLSLA